MVPWLCPGRGPGREAAHRLERVEALDKVVRPLAGAVGRAVRPRVVRNLLSGTDLGHALHPVLRTGQTETVYALASTCTHVGGPLREGTISDGCVTCPWPGSTFRFADGSIVRGPCAATASGKLR